MTDPTPAQSPAHALKDRGASLDEELKMRLRELERRVRRADYEIDPRTIAHAMLRRAVSHRRCWKPASAWRLPPALSATSAGPSPTLPIQVSGAAASASERASRATQTHSS